jgi:hypothetical protein
LDQSREPALFYASSPSAGVEVAVSNTTDQAVQVGLVIRGENPGGPEGRTAGPNQPIALGPHKTEVVNLRPFLPSSLSGPSAGGVIVSHSGVPGDILVQGMLSDRDGFSANMRFLELAMLTSLDLNSPIYQRGEAKPIVLLSNTGTETGAVELRARYTVNGQKQERVLRNLAVGPRNAAHADLSQSVESLPPDASELALILKSPNGHAGILADVLLVDSSGSGVLQMFPKGERDRSN